MFYLISQPGGRGSSCIVPLRAPSGAAAPAVPIEGGLLDRGPEPEAGFGAEPEAVTFGLPFSLFSAEVVVVVVTEGDLAEVAAGATTAPLATVMFPFREDEEEAPAAAAAPAPERKFTEIQCCF